jgi:hypothetical protein
MPRLLARTSSNELQHPVRLSDEAMTAVLAASYPMPADRRGLLVAVARELAGLPEVGDGVVHRVVTVRPAD